MADRDSQLSLTDEFGNAISPTNPFPVKDLPQGLEGSGANGTVALSSADTWVQVPTTPPTAPYVLAVTKENEAGIIRWGFDNTGTPSATNGDRVTTPVIIQLGASEVIYFGSDVAGDDVNFTTKEIEA